MKGSRRLLPFVVIAASACATSERLPGERRYDMTGEVVAVDASRLEVTLAHDAIAGYMSAMVMPFKVREPALVSDLRPGDLVRGRLVVNAEDGFIETLERTGHRRPSSSAGHATPNPGDFLIEGDTLPDVRFVDQDGTARPLRPSGGAVLVMTFVYTRCPFPTFCPLLDRHFKSLQKTILDDTRLVGRVQLLSITVDPEFDTPAVLRAHAARLGADSRVWNFATPQGTPASEVAPRLGVSATRDAPGSALIVHNLVTVVAGRDGVVERVFRGNEWTPGDIKTLLSSMLGSPS